MRLQSVVIEGFRGFVDRVEIDLAADVIIIYGPNGVGKTSLLDAVLWAITGRIDRFAGKGDPVSLYAREGIARVELTLVEAGQVVIITRATDGTNDTVRLREGGEELDGAVAESRLTDLLLPQLRERVAAPMTLSNVITRSVYLQQDLVRQFIETDTPAERFSLLSEVIGAGAVLELQQTLEKGRNQWSRSTNALRKETLDPLKSRLDKVNEQLARLESEVAIGETDAREETERLFRRALELIGQTRLSVTAPPTSSSRLDGLLKEPERVEVLHLRPGSEFLLAAKAQRHVRVAAHRSLLHVAVTDVEVTDQFSHFREVLIRLLGSFYFRFRNHL